VFKKGRRKWQVEVDYLIDDSPNNHEAWVAGRQMEDGFLLLDRPWNEKVDAQNRVNNIKEAMDLINE
jgi:5'(3')-deoxyribonucleotidase